MTHKAKPYPDIPYPDMIMKVGERIARRCVDESIQAQIIQFRKEEQEKRDGNQKLEVGRKELEVKR